MKSLIIACLLLLAFSPLHAADQPVISVSKKGDFKTAQVDMTIAIMNNGYILTKIQPIDQGLRSKGYESEDYHLVFFGNQGDQEKAIAIEPRISVLLPLKIMIYRLDGGRIGASIPNLSMWKQLYRSERLNPVIDKWQHDSEEILKEFAGR